MLCMCSEPESFFFRFIYRKTHRSSKKKYKLKRNQPPIFIAFHLRIKKNCFFMPTWQRNILRNFRTICHVWGLFLSTPNSIHDWKTTSKIISKWSIDFGRLRQYNFPRKFSFLACLIKKFWFSSLKLSARSTSTAILILFATKYFFSVFVYLDFPLYTSLKTYK